MLKASATDREQSPPLAAIAKYSISSLASSIYYNCEKHIYLLSKSARQLNDSSSDGSDTVKNESIKEAHCERGNEFEEKLFERHRSVMVDHSKTQDFKQALREAEPGKYLYQLKCSLPESFYQDIIHNTTSYRINNFIPDFLYIRLDPVTNMRRIFIIDAKASKKMSNSHQFQVSSYAFFLSYLITDIHNLEVDDMGGVWLPSNMDAPEQFRIDFVLNKIKYMYIDTLVRISKDPNPQWVLGSKCVSCPFLKRCKSDAKGTVRSIPYMNEEKAKQLKNNSMVDIEDLSELLNTLQIDATPQQQQRKALTGYEDYLSAYNDHQPRFMGYASVYTARAIDHAVYIYLQMDTYSERPFVYGMQVVDAQTNQSVSEYYFTADYQEHLQDELVVYTKFAEKFVTDLTRVLQFMDQQSSRCLFYVYDGQEKKQIQRFLYNVVIHGNEDLVSLQEKDKKKVISEAMQCLVILFQDTQLLGLPGIVQFPDMDDLPKTSAVGRFTGIEQLLQQNIALGVSGYYGLSDAVEWMTSGASNEQEDELVAALSGLDLNEIYTHWKTPPSPGNSIACATERLVSKRFTWLQKIMSTYWRLATEYMQSTGTDLFPLKCKPFKWPTLKKFNNQILAKLVFFKQLECIKSCDEVRMDRIRDLSKLEHHISVNETTLGGLILEYEYGVGSDFDYDHTFSVSPTLNGPHVQQKMDSLKMDTFKQYILVPDDRDGIIETIVYPDLQYKTAGTFQKKSIRCVDIKAVRPHQIVVHSYNLKKSLRRWRLYKRYTDFTVDRCTETLRSLDNDQDAEGLADVMELVQDPNAWSSKNPTCHDHIDLSSNTQAQQLLDEFAMSASQKDISASIFERRLQIIWGPPGSGKTEFLALFINWYIKCFSDQHANKGKELMIGVTAFTRDAIVNLLKRIEKVQRQHGLGDLFSIMYVNKDGGEALEGSSSSIMCVEWKDSIKTINKLKKATPIKIYVVGATVWGWDRIRNNWKRFKQKGCDIMILDESTQLLVSDAILAIACLSKPSGKLIVAGDHMQLGPIIKNNYSDIPSSIDDPLLYGSIQQCLMRTRENHAIPTREFLLQKGALHDFGPNTLQLKDNWRMNSELNSFFQQIYGPDYTSRFPETKLQLDWAKPQERHHASIIQAILDPLKSIALVKLQQPPAAANAVENEANMVQQLVSAYLDTNTRHKPSVMIVTPHHQQRIAIKRKLDGLSSSVIPIDTVEKMQGQECELIIACFSCTNNKRSRNNEFLRDFRRWNVALSRARTKVIVLTVEELLNPNPTEGILESFHQPFEPTDGYALLCLLQDWAQKKNSVWTI
ncbi:hypothetical protein V8B55DRAFT_1516331 [Mucor lusitanicus]|uniref:DNA2/NAM7 helicase-like C-terminal domain-containing protein n=1 Tax=Mucor circinelloides f. lusitanicus TaxID=29924 RepID=A0A8H4EWW6_MUCCL|nr:hypothetical protein FB192DRAFT_1399783 [Mucor lusitanicus]